MDVIPTRYNINDNDYNPALGSQLRVYLDDKELKYVVGYDIAAGEVTVYKRVDGQFILRDKIVQTEILKGNVIVTLEHGKS